MGGIAFKTLSKLSYHSGGYSLETCTDTVIKKMPQIQQSFPCFTLLAKFNWAALKQQTLMGCTVFTLRVKCLEAAVHVFLFFDYSF